MDVNPFGPVQVKLAPGMDVVAPRFSAKPAQTGELLVATGVEGVGFTVTVIVYDEVPGQVVLAVEVGVTRYCTVPAVVLLGFVNICAIVEPDPALAPVMPPVIVPMVHANVLGVLAVNAMLVAVALHIVAVFAVVTTGVGFTVTVMVYGVPGQAGVAVDVGVTMYCTLPAPVLLGLFNVCAMVEPAPALAPVMPPVTVPIVHVNVLGAVAVSAMLVVVPLQIAVVAAVVTTGRGLTVTVIV